MDFKVRGLEFNSRRVQNKKIGGGLGLGIGLGDQYD